MLLAGALSHGGWTMGASCVLESPGLHPASHFHLIKRLNALIWAACSQAGGRI